MGYEQLTNNSSVLKWIEEVAELCKPDKIYWCDGSESEKQELEKQAFKTGELIQLNQQKLPGCTLHRSDPNDVARTEDRTFICTPKKEDAGPLNNWMAPDEAYSKLQEIFRDSMKGKTMYIIPFIMGIPGSKFNKIGIQITDSLYVVLNMRIMTTMGKIALDELGDSDNWTRCLHATGTLDPNKRYICHFPQDNTIWAINSNYGGNALLGKKCLALRIASYQARKEDWMAEHMLIVGIENPKGETKYIAAAFPSGCGKTNLSMIVPPKIYKEKGWKVWIVGDDIAWMRIGEDGRLWAINPEAGFFGIAPGTNSKTNLNMMETIKKNTIYTNVALRKDGTVWWEGHDDPAPKEAIDWRGERWTPEKGTKAAHPNSRFTVSKTQCPIFSPEGNNPKGVPISAIIFGGRRSGLIPLVYQSFGWEHGVFMGATVSSETTAATTGKVGVVRYDPMAMRPFIGYNVGDYLLHWLEMGKKIQNPPKIFYVNWFRKDDDGNYLWPGFGENLRALEWILKRCKGEADAKKTAIGYVPTIDSLSLEGLNISKDKLNTLLSVNNEEWIKELPNIEEWLKSLGGRAPSEIWKEFELLKQRLKINYE